MTTSPFQLLLAEADRGKRVFEDQLDGPFQAELLNEVVSETRLARQAQPFLGEFIARLGRAAMGSSMGRLISESADELELFLATDAGGVGIAPSPDVPFSILLQERPEVARLVAAARMGWASVATFSGGLDAAGVQYFTEWCRELQLSIIWLVADERELAALLKSDAPYVGLLVSEAADGAAAVRCAVRLRSRVPPECVTICFFEVETRALQEQLGALKCSAYVDIGGGLARAELCSLVGAAG